MNLAARVIAATAYDLYTAPEIIQAAQAELRQRLGGHPLQDFNGPRANHLWTTGNPAQK